MLNQLPQKFFSGCGCNSGTGSVPSGYAAPTATPIATICDDRYLTMTSVPAGRLIVIPPGSNCQSLMENSDAESLIVSAGGALGYKWTKEPKLSLPKLVGSPATGAPTAFPYIMVSNGSGSVTPWQQLPCPTAGEWYIKGTTGGWTLVENSPQATQLGVTFAAAATGTALEAIGFVDVGAGVYQPRRLIGSSTLDVPMMLHYNGTSGRYEMKAAAITDSLYIGNIKATTFGEVSALGVPTADSFSARPNSGITQADIYGLVIDAPNGKIYRAPRTKSWTQDNSTAGPVVTPNTSTWIALGGGHGSISITPNSPVVLFMCDVSWDLTTGSGEFVDFALFLNGSGVEVKRWRVRGEKDNNLSFIASGLNIGAVNTLDVKIIKSGSGSGTAQVAWSSINIIEIENPGTVNA